MGETAGSAINLYRRDDDGDNDDRTGAERCEMKKHVPSSPHLAV